MSNVKQGLNGMVVEAFATLCETQCKDASTCHENCDAMQKIYDMLFKYPTIYRLDCPDCDTKILIREQNNTLEPKVNVDE